MTNVKIGGNKVKAEMEKKFFNNGSVPCVIFFFLFFFFLKCYFNGVSSCHIPKIYNKQTNKSEPSTQNKN